MTDIGGGFEDRDHNALMTVEELTERVRETFILFLQYVFYFVPPPLQVGEF